MDKASEFLVLLTLCALLGATGQSTRVIVGLKKLRDEAAAKGQAFSDVFQPATLAVSLIIGGVAGVIAGLALNTGEITIDHKFALGIMAAGYAGADFIEGFMSREAAKLNPPPAASAPSAETPAVG